jgi:hypothetical protein
VVCSTACYVCFRMMYNKCQFGLTKLAKNAFVWHRSTHRKDKLWHFLKRKPLFQSAWNLGYLLTSTSCTSKIIIFTVALEMWEWWWSKVGENSLFDQKWPLWATF